MEWHLARQKWLFYIDRVQKKYYESGIYLWAPILMAARKMLSFRIPGLAAALFLFVMTTLSSLSGQCLCCNHDRHDANRHESKLTYTLSSPLNDYPTNCLSFFIFSDGTCNEELLGETRAVSSIANVVPADCAQDDLQPGSFASGVLPVYLIKKTLRL